MAKRPNPKMMALQVENWNLKNPVGTAVVVTKDDRKTVETVTTSEAYVMGGHSAVVHLRDVRGCYMLDRVRPVAA